MARLSVTSGGICFTSPILGHVRPRGQRCQGECDWGDATLERCSPGGADPEHRQMAAARGAGVRLRADSE